MNAHTIRYRVHIASSLTCLRNLHSPVAITYTVKESQMEEDAYIIRVALTSYYIQPYVNIIHTSDFHFEASRVKPPNLTLTKEAR